MIVPLLLAVSLEFSGVLAQSAAPEEKPISFLGSLCAIEAPDGRVWFHGGGQKLCRIEREGEFTTFAVSPIVLNTMFSDGVRLWCVAGGDLAPIAFGADGAPRAEKCVHIDLAFNNGAIRPETKGHPFEKVGKFFTHDDKRGKLVRYDASGRRLGDFADFPWTGRKSSVCAMAFLPETGQLVAVTHYPDCRIYRFNPDGTRDDTGGWPIFRGYGFFQTTGGRLWHLNGASMMEVRKNFSVATAKSVDIGPGSSTRGYAEDPKTGCRYVASYQGVCWAKPGEAGFPHRIGGLVPLMTLALDRGEVIFSTGVERVRKLWIDDVPDAPLSSVDTLSDQYSWTEAITAIAPFGRDFITTTAKHGPEYYIFRPDIRTKNGRRRWHPYEFEPALPTNDCRAVAADFETRAVYFSTGARIWRGEVPLTDAKKPMMKVRDLGVSTDGEVLFLARGDASRVAFATAKSVGVFRASDGTVLWRGDAADVTGLAVTEGLVAVADGKGLRLLSLADGAVVTALDPKSVPSGYVCGCVAAEGSWVVLEDRRSRRFLRLRICN